MPNKDEKAIGEEEIKISVIIPSYNREKLVVRAIQSVLIQTYQNFEIIIVDDASDDNTENNCKKLNDKRIRYVRLDKNSGAPKARNRGIKEAVGEYVAFLDSDDEWMPEKLERQISLLNRNRETRIGLISTGYNYIIDEDKIVGKFVPNEERVLINNMAYKNIIGSLSSVMAYKEGFENCGYFDETLPSCQDWDLYIRFSKLFKIESLEEALVKYHIDNDRITLNYKAKAKGHKIILRKYYDEIKRNRRYHSEQRFVIAHYLALSGDIISSIKEYAKAIRIYPLKIKYYYYMLFTIFGPVVYRKTAELKSTIKRHKRT